MKFASKEDAIAHSRSHGVGYKSWSRVCTPKSPRDVLPNRAFSDPDRYPLRCGTKLDFTEWTTFRDRHACEYVSAVCREEARDVFPGLFDGYSDEHGHHYSSIFDDPRIAFIARQAVGPQLNGKKIAVVQTGDVVNLHYEETTLPPSETGYSMGSWVAYLSGVSTDHPRIFELGVGSGIIMASALHHLRDTPCTYIAGDLDGACLSACETSLRLNQFDSDNWRLKQGDGFDVLRGERVDMVVSNPPYFPTDWANQSSHIGPRLALDGGRDGLKFYRLIFEQAPRYLRSGGKILVQVSNPNIVQVLALAKDQFGSDARISAIRSEGKQIFQPTNRGRAVLIELI